MSMMSEFKEFALKGNVMDLAVGVIIGGAFGKIVDSLVADIIMPVLSLLSGGHLDFTNLFIILGTVPEGIVHTHDALKKAGVPLFSYGSFITVSLNFVILAFVIFHLVKVMNHLRNVVDNTPEEPTPEPEGVTPEDILLLREIRDQLKK
jgi:large conductance mechanosensitive channel